MKIAFYSMRDFDELPYVERLSKEYGIDYVWTNEHLNERTITLAEGCDAFSSPPIRVTEADVDQLKAYGVKSFLCSCIGYDHLPVEYIRQQGLHISTTPYPADSVANYAIMLMLMTARRMNQTMLRANVQDFSLKGKMGRDLSSMTVGIIGTGSIGKTVVKHLSGFGCRILAYARHPDEEVKQYAEYVDLDTIYRECDLISLHAALNPGNFHMINEESLAKMMDGVLLVNTARGGLIDTHALVNAIKSGKVGGAGLDVYEDDTKLFYINRISDNLDMDDYNLLRCYPNVIVSPHNAFYTETTIRCMMEEVFVAADCYRSGKPNPYEIL